VDDQGVVNPTGDEAGEQHRTHPESEAAVADLADQVTHADHQK